MNAYEFIIKMKNYASSELRKVAQELGVADNKSKQFTNDLKKNEAASKSLGSALGGLKGKLIGLFAGVSLMAFTSQVVTARAEYEKFDAVLSNTFQSKDVGQGALAMLTDFAAKTPYQLNELTGGFIKLVNRGILPTVEEMTKMGDLASSQGKSFDQLVEAIMDGQTGEFERLKEFGIKASKNGDLVKLSFKGVTKEVANNENAIKDAIIAYGAMKGVAGSMEVVSKTLGGQLSNLEDQWWGFLVAVGGYGGGVFGEALSIAGDGLAFLQVHLPEIAHWFDLLWQYISPLVNTLKAFFNEAIAGVFGISDTKTAMEGFLNVMSSVLLVVDWLSTGLSTFLGWIQPLAPYIMDAAIAWGIFNAVIAISPIGWIIIGIMAVMTLIGMVMKYTDGWGKSWIALKTIFKAVWNQIAITFDYYVEKFKYNFDMIILKAKQVAESVSNFFSSGDQASNVVDGQIEKRQKEWADKQKQLLKDTGGNIKTIQNASKDIGITVDKKGISDDFEKIKKSFSGITGDKKGNVDDYNDYLNKNKGLKAPGQDAGKDKKDKKDKDGIVSGGSKQTNITINIEKIGTDTKIYVSSVEKGLNNLGEKVQEELLRAVNSVNQMQTG